MPIRKARLSSFRTLAKYMTDPQSKHERVGVVRITNCHSLDVDGALLEIEAVQSMNKRATTAKTYHLVVSFPKGEEPMPIELKEIERQLCEDLGFGEHQRLSAVHHDTDNLHVHIAINKIHPRTHKSVTPYNDHLKLADTAERLEKLLGLEPTSHTPKIRTGAGRARDMEHAAGIESLLGWVQRECLKDLAEATSWSELNAVLQQHGLQVKKQGNGLIFQDSSGVAIKASSVSRDFSKARLEAKFGTLGDHGIAASGPALPYAGNPESLCRWMQQECLVDLADVPSWSEFNGVLLQYGLHAKQRFGRLFFEDESGVATRAINVSSEFSQDRLEARFGTLGAQGIAAPKSARRYSERPMASRVDTSKLYAKYKAEMAQVAERKPQQLSVLKEHHAHRLSALKNEAALKRKWVKALPQGPLAKRVLYARIHKDLSEKIASLQAETANRRLSIHADAKRRTWNDWLQIQATNGDQDATLALRARLGRTPGQGANSPIEQRPPIDGVTKGGTVKYRVDTTMLRDDGKRLQVAKEAGADAMHEALLTAVGLYGKTIKVNGTEHFKKAILAAAVAHRIDVVFEDAALEKQRREAISTLAKDEHESNRSGPDDARNVGNGSHTSRTSAWNAAARRNGFIANGRTRTGILDLNLRSNTGEQTTEKTDRVSDVSQLGLVQHGNRGEVLLPRHVPGDMEHRHTGGDDKLRRLNDRARSIAAIANGAKTLVPKVGTQPPPAPLRARNIVAIPSMPVDAKPFAPIRVQPEVPRRPAVDGIAKYIEERESKRLKGIDIPKHTRYNPILKDSFIFAGVRNIDGEFLALLKSGDEIRVMRIDDATSRRLRRLKLGDLIEVSPKGLTKPRTRSR